MAKYRIARCRSEAAEATPRSSAARSHVATLKRAGWGLILVGLADIAYMVHCIATGESYSSSFNIFALTAGIFLVRGNLTAARLVAHASAFWLGAFLSLSLLVTAIVPWDLLVISARLAPGSWVVGLVVAGAVVALLLWLHQQLTSEPLATAFENAGKKPVRTKISLGFGLVVFVVIGLVVRAALSGGSAQQATEQARQQMGPGYRFFVTEMSVSESRKGTRGVAKVIAYRSNEIHELQVKLGSTESEDSDASQRGSEASSPQDVTASASDASDHVASGHKLYQGGQLQSAIGEYTLAVQMNPNDADAHYWRAAVYARTGEHDKALADLAVSMNLDPDEIRAYELADWILARRGEWEAVILRWTSFIERHPDNGKAFFERGGAYHHKGDQEAARRDAEQACTLRHEPACQILKRI